MPEAPLDTALDELYGSDPADFVANRKRLTTALRDAGEKTAATELQGARRPSTAAWALNQLARRRPELVETLLDRSRVLQAAQTRALSGKPDAMRDAMSAHRAALADATDATLAILGERANDNFRNEIVSTLRAASADEDTGQMLRSGRVIHEVAFPGFPDAAGLTLVSAPPESKQRGTGKPKPRRGDRPSTSSKSDAAARREHEREAKRRVELAQRQAALRRAAVAADAEAARAQKRVDHLQKELAKAERELQAARERSRRATDDARPPD
jgi:hypothetical protein